MAYISASKTSQLKPKLFSDLSRSSHQSPLKSLYFFCSSSSPESPFGSTLPAADQTINPNTETPLSTPLPAAEARNGEELATRRIPRGKHRNPEKIEDIICRMMANRAWTTRLQNSIRNLVQEFDHSLVYNVLHTARNSEHALQFFRWVERSGLFHHDRETHYKIIEILGRASKLNHARCILLDMPSKGVEWDEDLFVMMIDSYGKAGIVQKSVKMFHKMEELGVERTLKSYDILFRINIQNGPFTFGHISIWF